MKRALLLILLAACRQAPAPAAPAPEAPACVGEIEAHDGLAPVDDHNLLTMALGKPGEGKLCAGQVFEATAPVTVYRVWTAAKDWSQLGGWWSFDVPQGPVDAYREANAICPEWSDLDRVSSCTIKLGAHVVVGPGQSATCEAGLGFAASAVNQVFIPNDTRIDQVFVEDCTPGEAWPAP